MRRVSLLLSIVLTISLGTVAANAAHTGMWMMTRLDSTLAVRQTGFSEAFVGHQATNITWGAEIKNPSATRDALDVTVTPTLIGTNGKVISPDDGFASPLIVKVIPAGQTVYVGADNTSLFGDVHVRAVQITATAASTPPRRYGLPTVSNVQVNHQDGKVTATVTNPYETPMSVGDYTAEAVVYDSTGRIIGGDSSVTMGNFTRTSIKPGGRMQISILPFDVPKSLSR